MKCVKLGSIMGSYLTIHLNLFPVYVLLLLLTLSHGRPSARIRESRYSKNPIRDSNNIISSLSNFHAPRLSLVNQSSNSIISMSQHHKNIENSYPSKQSSMSYIPKKNEIFEVTKSSGKGATGSWDFNEIGNSPSFTRRLELSDDELEPKGLIQIRNNVNPSKSTGINGDYNYKKPQEKTGKKKMRRISSWKELEVPSLISPTLVGNEIVEDALVDKSPMDLLMGQTGNDHYPQVQEIMDEDETDEMGSPEDQQQLDKFRMNILKELGFQTTQELFKKAGPTSTGYLSDIPSPITPKWNISREDYFGAYTQYMFNVKQRKEKARANLGPRNRRKNAVTFVYTYYDNGSDHLMSEGGVMRTFSFDINTETKTIQGSIRVRKATLSIPASCSLINGFRGRRSVMIGGNNISSIPGMESNDDKEVTYDLTDDVTSWMFHADSSPFEVTVSCSNSHEGKNWTTSASSTDSSLTRSGSLRLVTAELTVPTDRSRRRRSAQKSTLQNFENKQGKGRDCTKTRRGKTCCRRSLKVKFSELGISDVIIEPQEFDAHVCVGRCNAKRVAYSTTHAMFQHILHQTKGKKFAPRPCCTPTKLTELDVIHLDPTGTKLQVTVLKDAIVEECGCS